MQNSPSFVEYCTRSGKYGRDPRPPLATLLAQNKRRSSPVPEKVVLRLVEKLEPPTLAECHQLTIEAPL